MEWSNLNEQMIEQFFQNSNSPSNADVSLNFTRTSRQSGSNSKHMHHRQNSPQVYKKSDNPESDFLTFANKQIQKFDSWFNFVNSQQQKSCRQKYHFSQTTEDDYLSEFYHCESVSKSLQKSQSLQNHILQKIQNLSNKLSHPASKNCQNCITFQNKLSQLQMYTKSIEIELKAKNEELKYFNEVQINQLGQQMEYEVQNRLLHQEIIQLKSKYDEILEILEVKQRDINKLNEEIEKFNLKRSTFHFKNRTLENKVLEMQKSKSSMLSATKHSTSHSQFNITSSNNNNSLMMKSQQQSNTDSTLIHTNQFSTQKPSPEEYIQWFQKVKQVFLEKYRHQQKQHLLKQHPQAIHDKDKLKEVVNKFKRKHVRYEVARSCKSIAEYIKKNKENFLDLIGNETLSGLKIGIQFGCGKENGRNTDDLEEELRKSQKIAKGLQSQICHLNSQLATLKKTLIREKQEKAHLLRTYNNMRQQLEQTQGQLHSIQQQLNKKELKKVESNLSISSIHEIQQKFILLQQQLAFKSEELTFKSEELKKIIYKCKRQEEAQQKLELAVKQSEYLLYKERKDKIKFFKESISSQNLTTACSIRPKSITEKHLSSIMHEREGKVFVDKEKMSYKYDIIEQVGRKAESQIISAAKKIVLNCIYEQNSSLLLSMGSNDSEFKEFMRNEKGLLWICVNEIFKLRQSEKRFIQINVSINSIGMLNSQVYDALDRENLQKKISIKREGSKFSLLNCITVPVQTEQEVRSLLTPAFFSQKPVELNLITILELSILDKRSKQKYTSKLIFGEVGLYNSSKQQPYGKQNVENLIKDSQAIWNVFKSINFKQKYQPEFNRLTHLLSECLNQNSKNLLVMNISPTELYKQISIVSLTYGSSLKSLQSQPHSSSLILRQSQKSQQHSTSKLMENKSQSLIKTPTLSTDIISEEKPRSILKHRNSSSQHPTSSGGQNLEKKKRTISRLSIC